MAKRLAMTSLNGRAIDILNVIRTNASYQYQNSVPDITDAQGIPKVGEVLYGNPTLANEFINALVNRIALVVANSAVFNNPYKELKKGFLEYGETVEEIFVKLIQVQEFSVEKAPAREFKRTLPDVQSAFHTMNWRVLYPISIQREDLKRAFLNADGLETFINSIIEQIYVSAEYDEFLLFKYMLIKAISHGKAYPVGVSTDSAGDMEKVAVSFRGMSNTLNFLKSEYNEQNVKTNSPRERQYIFMDANFNAKFDVEVLARAFNMDKAEFVGHLKLIDDWDTFDNERWEKIVADSDQVETVTDEELALMSSVRAVIVDERWFQVYDNETTMTDEKVSAGLYWNYFYHVWKTISHSPFSNLVVFVEDTATVGTPSELTFKVAGVVRSEISTIITLELSEEDTLQNTRFVFVQDKDNTENGTAITPDGAIIIPDGITAATPILKIDDDTYTGTEISLGLNDIVGETITFTKNV